MSVTTILIRAILLFLSLVSFIPQYRRILSRGDCSGISLYYVLFNLIAATEQFALGLHLHRGQCRGIRHYQRPGPKRTALAVYISFLLISLVPVVFESFLPPPGDSPERDRRWFSAIFTGVHTMFINPVITIIGFASLFPQARETLSRPSPGALSIAWLAIQAAVFAVVALYWPLRMKIPREFWDTSPLRSWITWYQLVGWAAVDNAVLAFVQAVLLWIAMRRRGEIQGMTTNGEITPLLHG